LQAEAQADAKPTVLEGEAGAVLHQGVVNTALIACMQEEPEDSKKAQTSVSCRSVATDKVPLAASKK